jgi:hypothetical protein
MMGSLIFRPPMFNTFIVVVIYCRIKNSAQW